MPKPPKNFGGRKRQKINQTNTARAALFTRRVLRFSTAVYNPCGIPTGIGNGNDSDVISDQGTVSDCSLPPSTTANQGNFDFITPNGVSGLSN